jgi:iron(III) transport system permease protein
MFEALSNSSHLLFALNNSLLLLLGVGLGVLLLGLTLAWLVLEQDPIGQGWLQYLLLLPLAVPPVVLTWAVQLPPLGWAADAASASLLGAVLIYSLSLYPLIYLPLLLAARLQSAATASAVRLTDLQRGDYLRRIALPLARYPLLSGLLLVLLQVLLDYPSQQLLGLNNLSTLALTRWQLQADLLPILPHLGLLLILGLALAGSLLHLRGPRLPPLQPVRRPYLGAAAGRMLARIVEPAAAAEKGIRLLSAAGSRDRDRGYCQACLLLAWGVALLLILASLAPTLWAALGHLQQAQLDARALLHSLLLAGVLSLFTLASWLLVLLRQQAPPAMPRLLLRHGPLLVAAVLCAAALQQLGSWVAPGPLGLLGLLLWAWLARLKLGLIPELANGAALPLVQAQALALALGTGRSLWRCGLSYRIYLLRRWLPGLALLFLFGLRELPLSQLLLSQPVAQPVAGQGQTLAMGFYAQAVQHPEQAGLSALLMCVIGLIALPLVWHLHRLFFLSPLPSERYPSDG